MGDSKYFARAGWNTGTCSSHTPGKSAFLLALLAGACAEPVAESTTQACAAIVGGEPDRAHDAVVAVLDRTQTVVCSGTLIGADETGAAVVLTAAHCLDHFAAWVAFGQELTEPGAAELAAAVVSVEYHPLYARTTGAFDLALLTLDAPPPVAPLPVAATDRLEQGSSVTLVGYGETSEDGALTNERNRVAVRVEELTLAAFAYDQTGGGPCYGDSGGPAIVLGDTPLLVGVTSYGEGGCRGRGVSVRTSAALDFIASAVSPTRGCTAAEPAGPVKERR
jgi:hypothetical protein